MQIEEIRTFFMWCSVINMGLLTISFIACSLAGNLIYRIHSKLFPIPREKFNGILYALFGLYKILIFAFNIVPFIALSLIN